VKAVNGAGISGTAAASNGQTSDTSAPGASAGVRDGESADAAWTASTTTLFGNWDACSDTHSGITKYWYAIGTSAGGTQTVNWTDAGNTTCITATGLTLSDGQIYYFSVKAENGAGLPGTAANSNGITVDTSAPTGAPAAPSDAGESTGGTELIFTWTAGTAADAHSGIEDYYVQVGTAAGGNDKYEGVVSGTTVTVTGCAGGYTYYARAKARNGAGLYSSYSGNSDGIFVSTTPPELSWEGTGGLADKGVENSTGKQGDTFVFKIVYKGSSAPKSGYPKLHILKSGNEITGSPFQMAYVSGNCAAEGAGYSKDVVLSACGMDYEYYFEALSILDLPASGSAAASRKSLRVYESKVHSTSVVNNRFNPANGEKTYLYITVNTESKARLTLHDFSGREVKSLVNENKLAGNYEYTWDGKDETGGVVKSGVYLLYMDLNNVRTIKKIIVIK
jgi:hypothetical protein